MGNIFSLYSVIIIIYLKILIEIFQPFKNRLFDYNTKAKIILIFFMQKSNRKGLFHFHFLKNLLIAYCGY